MKIKNLLLVFTLTLFLTACQSNVSDTQQTDQKANDYGKPYSNGPKENSIPSGPTTPPPDFTDSNQASSAQAVTTKENIRLTLPLKTN